jgi:putative phosphoribosyl transferase
MRFRDRIDAGRRLGAALRGTPLDAPIVVLGLPRGGVPVAAQVATALEAPLDVLLVRKLGVPWQPELAMGAIGEDDVQVLNDDVIRLADVSDAEIERVLTGERAELDRRTSIYRGGRPRVPVEGCTAVIVDDGIATGATARAACEVARLHGARQVVLAVPVAPRDWERRLGEDADRYVAVLTPAVFDAVGRFYEDFSPTEDAEVLACLSPGE